MFENIHRWPYMSGKYVHIAKYDDYQLESAPFLLEFDFYKASSYLAAIQSMLVPSHEARQALLRRELENMVIHAVFGSNKIENVGLSFEAAKDLCRQELQRQHHAEVATQVHQRKAGCLSDEEPMFSITQGQREVIQHMQAYLYMVQKFVVDGEAMSEDLIKCTHEILCRDIAVVHREGPETPAKDYAGIYRTVIVGAGESNFVVPSRVPLKMRQMCQALVEELADASDVVDPFSLAAKYSLEFVLIHPFLDGNGRMCRIILNAILFRFLGIFITIGEDDVDKEMYLGIKRRASARMEGHGEYSAFVLKKSMKSLRKLKQKLHGKCH
ncbi:hypothetical protein NLG97_g5126 [Lecanicillium saksenae]|uniref:Uncharacterized protein n=1 Tax=Lecanicillium saksenae TaxID=468837 RepID=A0ACC1QV23_9HYPO|nr:hypothetical protein NLG97_g5126 [Lecanicillium saksenae]